MLQQVTSKDATAHNRGCWFSCVLLRERQYCRCQSCPAILVPALENNARIVLVLADQSYRGAIAMRLQQAYDCVLELTEKLGQGFVVEPWRWVVERTFAWLENAHRLCRDYEELPEHHEASSM